MTQLAVDTQAEVMAMASPVIEEQTDYEFARAAIPGNLLQVDGLLRVSPDNEHLLLLGAKGWGSYAYGFVEDEMELAEKRADFEAADDARARARAMYLKSRAIGMRMIEQRTPEFQDALKRDPDVLKKFLNENFTEPSDAPALFWTAYSWGSAINISRDDPELLADLPFPRVLMERVVQLDETYYHAAGHVFLGVFHSSLGTSIGGHPETGKKHFERALQLTNREATIVQMNYAQSYAVQVQDRELFTSLLTEVIEAPPPSDPELSLANAVARRRAKRLLAQADSLILPPLPPLPEEEPAPAVPGSDESPPAETAPGETAPAPGTNPAPAGSETVPASPTSPKTSPASKPVPSTPAQPAPTGHWHKPPTHKSPMHWHGEPRPRWVLGSSEN